MVKSDLRISLSSEAKIAVESVAKETRKDIIALSHKIGDNFKNDFKREYDKK